MSRNKRNTEAPSVEETILKRKDVEKKLQFQKATAAALGIRLNEGHHRRNRRYRADNSSGKDRKSGRGPVRLIRPETLVKQYRRKERLLKRAQPIRAMHARPSTIIPKDFATNKALMVPGINPHLLLIIRLPHFRFHSRKNPLPRKHQLKLEQLGLLNSHVVGPSPVAILHKIPDEGAEEYIRNLRSLDAYLIYGHPNLALLRQLITKRAFTTLPQEDVSAPPKRVPVSDNIMVENALGHLGILCIEDIVHELAETGEHFDEVNKYLCPFVLKFDKEQLKSDRKTKNTSFAQGGFVGYRGTEINSLLEHII